MMIDHEEDTHREFDDTERVFDRAMDNVVGGYAARVAFLWALLSVTEGRNRMIPIDEMAERVSLILGRHVDTPAFVGYSQNRPEDHDVLVAMARVLEVDVSWLVVEV